MKNFFFSATYRLLLKPILFRYDPEKVHGTFLHIGKLLGASSLSQRTTAALFKYHHHTLEQTILGMHFPNPVGLSAGFDKNAEIINILPSVGFGFIEVGSVTGEPCQGNPKPRLWRLPKSRGLVVNYGLKNDGCEAVAQRLQNQRCIVPLGINIAKTNDATTVPIDAAIADYKKAFRIMEPKAQYLTINISCPNAYGGEPFANPERLELLLTHLDALPTTKPIFMKLPVDITTNELDTLVTVMTRHRVHGVIIANLTKQRNRPEIIQKEIATITKGGISGKPIFEASNHLIAHLFRTTGKRFIIIGVGGIFSAQDAYTKIRSGASLVQLITGMIFEGPQLIGDINRGLVELLKRDGYANITEAIGEGA